MDKEEVRERIRSALDPEPEPDLSPREWPCRKLETTGLKLEFLKQFHSEGSTRHPHTRFVGPTEESVHLLTQNKDVARRLVHSGLRLFADSILVYHDTPVRSGDVRFFPSVILTVWSGFETFVRYTSELFLNTAKGCPAAVADYLRDQETYVDPKSGPKARPRFQPVLNRYRVLLKFAYGVDIDAGNQFWQRLEQAKTLRDYYSHVKAAEPKAISSLEVSNFIESTLLGVIWPSSLASRTLMLGIFDLYSVWAELADIVPEYTEKPLFMDWPACEGYLIHCNFENVDEDRFPNADQAFRDHESA
jgi:hypothetical protein